jgi:hypothetical protein
VLQYPRYCSRGEGLRGRAARVAEALGTPVAGLRPRPAREKGFPSNLLLALIDTSPLLIKRGFLDP